MKQRFLAWLVPIRPIRHLDWIFAPPLAWWHEKLLRCPLLDHGTAPQDPGWFDRLGFKLMDWLLGPRR